MRFVLQDMHEREKIVLNLVLSVKLDEYCLQALLVPFVEYVQVLLAVAVAERLATLNPLPEVTLL